MYLSDAFATRTNQIKGKNSHINLYFMYNFLLAAKIKHDYKEITMANGVGKIELAKGAVIDQLIMENYNRKPTMSAAILAYSIDHALIGAGFESHLRVDYEQNLLAKENKHLGKELHQFLAEQGIPADTVKKVADMEAEGFRHLLKQLDAKYRLLDKAPIHISPKQLGTDLNSYCK